MLLIEAVGRDGLKGIFCKIEQNNCFVIQQIDNKAQGFIAEKPGMMFILRFFRRHKNFKIRIISSGPGSSVDLFSTPWPYLGSVTMC